MIPVQISARNREISTGCKFSAPVLISQLSSICAKSIAPTAKNAVPIIKPTKTKYVTPDLIGCPRNTALPFVFLRSLLIVRSIRMYAPSIVAMELQMSGRTNAKAARKIDNAPHANRAEVLSGIVSGICV